jgi:alpha-1,6-mannosyltransferase
VESKVRGVIGLLNATALIALGRGVERAFGRSAGAWFAVLQASQFHVMYYASRTLPNMYALVFSKSSRRVRGHGVVVLTACKVISR